MVIGMCTLRNEAHDQNENWQTVVMCISNPFKAFIMYLWTYLIVGIDPKNGAWNFGVSKIHFRVGFMWEIDQMHWYNYNKTIPLLNIAKSQILQPIYDFKNF